MAGRKHRLDVVERGLAAALAAAALACGCADDNGESMDFVQLPDSRLIKVQSVGLAAFGAINPHTATAALSEEAFGEPASVAQRGELCERTWPELGLTITFTSTSSDACSGGSGIERLVVSGRAAAAADWRTAEGVRPLQRVSALRRIYPDAGGTRGNRLVPVGPSPLEPGSRPVLVVRITHGRARALEFPIEAISD